MQPRGEVQRASMVEGKGRWHGHVGDHDGTRAVLQLLGQLRHALGNLVEREVIDGDVRWHAASISLALLRPLDGRVAGLGELESCGESHIVQTEHRSAYHHLHPTCSRCVLVRACMGAPFTGVQLSKLFSAEFQAPVGVLEQVGASPVSASTNGFRGRRRHGVCDAVPMRWRAREVSGSFGGNGRLIRPLAAAHKDVAGKRRRIAGRCGLLGDLPIRKKCHEYRYNS